MKKRKKKGFTLIELLAVIVILAIIALIATPIVMNLINKARKSATEDATYGVMKTAENYYAEMLLETSGKGIEKDIIFTCSQDACKTDDNKELTFNGTNPKNGKIKVTKEGKADIIEPLLINGYACYYEENKVNCDRKPIIKMSFEIPTSLFKINGNYTLPNISAVDINNNDLEVYYTLKLDGEIIIDNKLISELTETEKIINIDDVPFLSTYELMFTTKDSKNNKKEKYVNITVYDKDFIGISKSTYVKGDRVNYLGLNWQVVSDNGNNTTLILNSNYTTGEFGQTTLFDNTNSIYNILNTNFVNEYLKEEIDNQGLLMNENKNSYVRLITKDEVSSELSNNSGTNFWTMTASDDKVWYSLANGTFSYYGYTLKDVTWYYGATYKEGISLPPLSNIVRSLKTSVTTNDIDTLILPNQIDSVVGNSLIETQLTEYYSTSYSKVVRGDNARYYCHQTLGNGTNSSINWISGAYGEVYYAVRGNNCKQPVVYDLEENRSANGIRPVIIVREK